MEPRMKLAILTAWLHDIGKFAQRAKEGHSRLEHEFCPTHDGKYTHQHVLYTDYFIENILPLPDELKASASLLAGLAASHHRADGKSREHQAIQLADRLSSGMERTASEKEGDYIAERLDSIFSKVKLNGKKLDGKIPQYMLKPLSDEEESSGKTFFIDEECEAGEFKTFAMLVQSARIPPDMPGEPWRSIPCLGICKADVDNLGMVFSIGLTENFSLSCFAMLARMLNYFFAAFLMHLIKKEYPNIYVVFAGGDDLFVIGPWPETIAFALRMAEDFRKFCANNPALTISAGLPLMKAGLPMRAIREEAENLLNASKSYDTKNPKNALTLFGVSAHWPEAAKILAKGQWLAEICEENLVSNGFLRRLLDYSRQCGEFISGSKLAKNGLFLSHLSYDLARNYKVMENDSIFKEKGIASTHDFARFLGLPENYEFFAKLEMGISWALYRTRIS